MISIFTNAQLVDTVYLDKHWNESTEEDFKYYRTIKTEKQFSYLTDYYKNGTIQMSCLYLNSCTDSLCGLYVWYNRKGMKRKLILYDAQNYPSQMRKLIPDSLLDNGGNDIETIYSEFYKTGELESVGFALNECTPHGYNIYLRKDGKYYSILTKVGGILQGSAKYYCKHGYLSKSGNYSKGKKEGDFFNYDHEGFMFLVEQYYNGAVIRKTYNYKE